MPDSLRSFTAFGHQIVTSLRGRSSADRVLLEQTILPWYAAHDDVHRVLFVGCARFTRHYGDIFRGAEYWTIDPAARRRRWGARRHIVGRLEQLADHAPAEHFDLIICNGVLGWGLNRRADAEGAVAACFHALRPGGELVIGWNDVWPRNRVRPDSLQALRAFQAASLAGRAETRLPVPGFRHHVFECYRKPGNAPHPQAAQLLAQRSASVAIRAPDRHDDPHAVDERKQVAE